MSLINVTTPEKNVRELEFSVERAVFDKACNAAYKKNVGKMNIPASVAARLPAPSSKRCTAKAASTKKR